MPRKESVATAAVAILAVCAAALTALNIQRTLFPSSRNITQPIDTISNWGSFASVGQRVGPDGARVTLVVFSDYRCPHCRRLERELFRLRQRFSDELAVVWRHFPGERDEVARLAARAAVCGAEQGAFDAINVLLFNTLDSLRERSSAIAARAGIKDTVLFKECLRRDRSALAVDRDISAARRLRILVTPTLLINEALYSGLPNDLVMIVRRELRRAQPVN